MRKDALCKLHIYKYTVLFTVRVHYSNLKATYTFRDANTLAIRNE